MPHSVKKAVFPVAGLGTRFLPATKANPKEMLPIVDKPLIQYAVEEAHRAGFTEIIFITNSNKRAVEDHFDSNFELEAKLIEQDKQFLLELAQNTLPRGLKCTYVRQTQALGLGHAILSAEHVIGNEPFAVLLADDLIEDDHHECLAAMRRFFERTGQATVAVQEVARKDVSKYGVIGFNESQNGFLKLERIIEKPSQEQAPSNFAVIGRYVLTPAIFKYLRSQRPSVNGEIQLTGAIADLMEEERVFAHAFKGVRYDCGSKLDYMRASVAYALKHPEIGEAFQGFLNEAARSRSPVSL